MIAMAGKLIIDNKIAFEKDFDAAPYLPLE